ncbi:bifunctional hydroxymethylpyrimidine kinase/phosphomethylpyrimidine kinase [Actinoplanes sp. NPDC089786]|uniref:bifunctional hydroxymethylpyrimidine kinase/phosphomethylpyrimidine kinase n=1 Tax=Actinoplanes sp. NPDC089786 TaxID=3155185 RepID=UPI00341FB906
MTPPVVLTIAGSDSGGGAGIQADLKTFAALGVYGTSVITAITAQNTLGVTGVHAVPAVMVAAQLDAVLDDFAVAAVKVGMVPNREVAEVIAARIDRLPNLVVDPVLVATSGSRLSAVASVQPLLAYPCILTPNRYEAAALLEAGVRRSGDEVAAGVAPGGEGIAGHVAAELARCGVGTVVVTGSETAVDALHFQGVTTRLEGVAVDTVNNHGSGCTFSSAIAARLALGDAVPVAVREAKAYVATALRGGKDWELGAGPGPLDHFA